MEDTQSVGSSTWVITPRHSMLLRCSLTFGHKAMGHSLGMCIMGWTSCQSQILYSPGNLPIPVNWSGNSFINSSVDLMDSAAVWTVAGLAVVAVVETGAGCGGFVPGHMTVMTKFIFTTVSLLHEGRSRMAGLEGSVTYRNEFTWWGWGLGWPGHQVIGPQSAPYRGIWDPLYAVSMVLTWSRPVGRLAELIWFG